MDDRNRSKSVFQGNARGKVKQDFDRANSPYRDEDTLKISEEDAENTVEMLENEKVNTNIFKLNQYEGYNYHD